MEQLKAGLEIRNRGILGRDEDEKNFFCASVLLWQTHFLEQAKNSLQFFKIFSRHFIFYIAGV